jgi:hypothetical protein
MVDNIQRSRGRPDNYKLDRGGVPADGGPFLGLVMNNVDPTRSGSLWVYIETFGSGNIQDETKWIKVRYMPSFFGSTPLPNSAGTTDTVGTYPGNQNSYGMWFTPPDIGVTVMCVFVNGRKDQGFYIGVVPEEGLGHMVPGLAASSNFDTENKNQAAYSKGAGRLPVTEINVLNDKIFNNPKFYDQKKPVQSYIAGVLFQQGLLKDPERGTIGSSSQRESPSSVFGVSTPGRAVYQGGMKPDDIQQRVNAGDVRPNQAQVIGRVGGHSLVMDDGDIRGTNQMMRLRTTNGHQITMSDSGNFLYITHANGQTWIELGAAGTVDVFSTNSINLRSQGDINLHADRDINMYAGRTFKAKSEKTMQLESITDIVMDAQTNITLYSKATIGVKSDGTLTLNSAGGSWGAGSDLRLQAGGIDLNGPAADRVTTPNPITKTLLDDTSFSTSTGWIVKSQALTSIVSRAPTHEPYPYHNLGVDAKLKFEQGKPTPPPGAPPVPAGVVVKAL